MAKMQDDMPTQMIGGRPLDKTAKKRPVPPKRRGLIYAAGAIIAIIACMAIVLVAMLPKGTALPAMPNSLGFWEHIRPWTAQPPASTNNGGSWEGIPASARIAVQAHGEAMANPASADVQVAPVPRSHSAALAATEQSAAASAAPLETFRYSGQPALAASQPAAHSSLEMFRYTAQPAPAPAMTHVSAGSIVSDR
jgi:hypothetical protein